MRIQEFKRKSAVLFLILMAVRGIPVSQGAVNVTQYHNHENRDGLYIDPAYQGERTTLSTMMVRIDSLLNTNPSAETIENTSRRARKLVSSHATELVKQFPDTSLYLAKDLDDLTQWTLAMAQKLIVSQR